MKSVIRWLLMQRSSFYNAWHLMMWIALMSLGSLFITKNIFNLTLNDFLQRQPTSNNIFSGPTYDVPCGFMLPSLRIFNWIHFTMGTCLPITRTSCPWRRQNHPLPTNSLNHVTAWNVQDHEFAHVDWSQLHVALIANVGRLHYVKIRWTLRKSNASKSY